MQAPLPWACPSRGKSHPLRIDPRIRGVQERLSHLYDALETGKLELDDLAPRIKGLRADQQTLLADRDRAGAAGDGASH